jgi:tetratricopeptide (TPR) repeat protein
MLDKILKYSLPLQVFIIIYSAVLPDSIFSFLNDFSMTLLAITVFSFGWLIAGYIYPKDKNYKMARHIALAAIFATPILAIVFTPSFLYPYIVGKGFVFRFIAITAFLSSLYLSLTEVEYRPRLTSFFYGYLALVVTMGLATIFSMDVSRSFWSNFERMEGYINVISLFALLYALINVRLTELEWSKIFKVHVWISGLVSFVAILQYLIGLLSLKGFASLPILNLCVSTGVNCRVDATLGNSIYLGLYAALSFWLILYAIFAEKVKSKWLKVLLFVHLLAVLFSGTRGVWVGMLLGTIVLFISKFWFDGNKRAVAITIISAAAFVVLFAGFVTYANKNGIAQDITLVTRFNSINSLFARWNIWKVALESWSQKPLFGWGQENFIHAFNLNYNPAMFGQETYFDHPHNTYLGWLVMGGILGFLGFLYMLFMSVLGSVRSSLGKEAKNDLVIPIIFAFFVTYFVHIFFVFDNLTSSLLFLFAGAYFGYNNSYGLLDLNIKSDRYKKYFYYFIIIVFVVCTYSVVYKPTKANGEVIEAMTLPQRKAMTDPAASLNETRELYEKAIKLDTLGNYEIREFYLQKSLEYINLLPQVSDEKIKASIIDFANSALNQFKIQIEENPYDHRARFMLGLFYLNIKNYDLAITTLKEALDLAPNKQIALTYLAKAYLLKGEVQNSAIYYEKAIAVTPKNIPGYNQIRLEYIQILLLAKLDQKAVTVISELLPTANREEFNTLVSQMTQAYSLRQDLASVIKILSDAHQVDPLNQNFTVWLAQALVVAKNYNGAASVISQLNEVNPGLVKQFIAQTQEVARLEQEKQAAQKK